MQGTVSTGYEFRSNPLYFISSTGTVEKSVPAPNGHYSVLLPGGQTYFVNNYAHTEAPNLTSQYEPSYVPSDVKNFTENSEPIKPVSDPS